MHILNVFLSAILICDRLISQFKHSDAIKKLLGEADCAIIQEELLTARRNFKIVTKKSAATLSKWRPDGSSYVVRNAYNNRGANRFRSSYNRGGFRGRGHGNFQAHF